MNPTRSTLGGLSLRSVRRLAVLTSLVCALVTASPSESPAYVPDNVWHNVGAVDSYQGWWTRNQQATSYGITNLRSHTYWWTNATYAGTQGGSDVNASIDVYISSGGGTNCDTFNGAGRCAHWTVKFNPYYWTPGARANYDFWDALGCHEIVHTVGVPDPAAGQLKDSCLNGNFIGFQYATQPWKAKHLDPSEVTAVNNVFVSL
jgi:hypothetical protein